MSGRYAGSMEVEFEAIDGIFDDAVIERLPAPRAIDRPVPVAEDAAVCLASEDWSTDGWTALAWSFWRTAKTTGPFLAADSLALSLSGMLAQTLLARWYPDTESTRWAAPIALFLLIVVYWLSDLYSEIWVHPVLEFRQLTRVSTMALLAAAVGGALAWPIPLWCALAWPTTVALVPLLRTVARHCCVRGSWWGYPTLVIGSGEGAAALAGMLLECPRSALRPMVITDPEGYCRASVIPVVNNPATLESILRVEGIRHAVVSLPDISAVRLSKMLDRFSALVPHLLVLSDASTLPTLWGASRSCGRLSGIEVRNGLLLATLQGMKRVVDIVVALSVLCAGLPLLAAIAILVKLTSRGPVFYGQTRIGRHGRPFKAWKFRTMHPDGDALLRQYFLRVAAAQAEWERDHKLRVDPRVTRLGRLLRKWSLDELPQIWNVLRGEMSLVGPRPIVESEVRRYGNVFRQYMKVKPGITGLWQVSGRSDIGYDDRVRLDQFYIRHWSPWLDVYILAKTIVILVSRDGAY